MSQLTLHGRPPKISWEKNLGLPSVLSKVVNGIVCDSWWDTYDLEIKEWVEILILADVVHSCIAQLLGMDYHWWK